MAVAVVIGTMTAAAWAADPEIAAFNDNPDPVVAGGLVTYSARVDNSGPDAATNVVASVAVPAGATFVSATAPCVLAAGTVVCNLGSIAGGATDVRNLDFVFRANGPGPSLVTATITLTADSDNNPANNSQSQSTTVIQGSDLSLTSSASPNPVLGGNALTYTLTPGNAGPNAAADIVVTDNLPPSVAYQSASGSGWSCLVSGSVVTCNHAGPHPVGVAIPALTIVGIVNAAAGTITNTATVAPAAGGTADPDGSNNTTTTNTTVLAGADVLIQSKTVISATPAIAGQDVTFRIQPRNGGPATALNAVVTDNLPSGWTFVSGSGPNWSCSAAGLAVSCVRASFPTSAVDDITLIATAPSNAAVGQLGTSYTNTASIGSATFDPNAGNNSGSVGITVKPDGADLRIAKTKGPNPVAQGSALTSTIRVTNDGPRVATGTLRVVELLAGETYSSASGSGWTCISAAAPTIVCDNTNAGGLAVGASLPDLILTTIATGSGVLTNNACTGASVPSGAAGGTTASPPIEGDPNTTNDCTFASSTSTIIHPDLGISKTTSTPTGGDKIVSTSETSVTYTLVVSNLTSPGTDSATGTVISDTVPAFLGGRTTINPVTAVVSAGSATFSCAISSATVTCTQTGGQLSPGQTVTVPITVNRPMQDGTFTNTATVFNTVEGDPTVNNTASDTVTIEPIADIEMTGKTATPSAVRAGQPTTYTLAYRNNGPSTALGVVLTDQFTFAGGDSGATVVSIASSKGGSTCSIAAGAVLAPGADNFSCNLGSVADGETQSVTLVVRPNFQSGNAVRAFANTASLTTTSVENPAGGNNGNNSKSATLAVNPALVDLLTNKSDLEDPVLFTTNGFINYRITIDNNGPSFATNVHFTERMTPPAGKRIRFVCDVNGPSSAVCNPTPLCSVGNVTSAPGTLLSPFTCALPTGDATTGPSQGELAVSQSKMVYLRFEVLDAPAPNGDIYNNQATVAANEPDSFAANDVATEQTTVRQRIELAVTKSASLATVTMRQPFTWTVTVTNNGPGTSLQTDLTDALPAGTGITGPITFTKTVPAGSGTCSVAGSTLSCALGALRNGGVATILIPARVDSYPAGGTLVNTATVDTDPNKIGGIDPISANNSATTSMTVTHSSLSGVVFQDRDRAGANGGVPQGAASEPRIAGVALALTGIDLHGNAVTVSATSDASGIYTFADLAPAGAGGYSITETQPAGFVNSPASPPSAGAGSPSEGGLYAAGGSAGNSSFNAVLLGGNNAGTNYNFPEVRRPSLGGFVYGDSNLNGVRDPGTDAAVAGATVRLLNAATLAVVATTATDGTGAYVFANLDPFTVYTLEEPLPSVLTNAKNGAVNPGLVNGAPCATGCTAQPNTPVADTDRIATIDLGTGTDGTQFNFGEQPQTTIAGRVWLDADNNGTIGGSEPGIAGVVIELTGTDSNGAAVSRTTTTDANGNYAFASQPAGTYALREPTQPTATLNGTTVAGTAGGTATPVATVPSAISGITLGISQVSTGNNFGELPRGSIAGHVIADSNGNGRLDSGESGIANVTIVLSGTDDLGRSVSATVTTDAGGAYSFGDLRPGTYTVTEPTQSPGTVNGITTAGTVNGTTTGSATPTTTTPSAVAGIVLPPGGASIGNDFAEVGDSPDLVVSKASVEARFTVSNVATYTIRVRNIGQAPTSAAYRISDRLPAGLTLDAAPTGTGWSCVGAVGASSFICTSSDAIAANATSPNPITAKVRIAAAALQNSPAVNAVIVDGGGELSARAPSQAELDNFNTNPANLPLCDAAITQNACRTSTQVQAAASISGTVWSDVGSGHGVLDGGDVRLGGWLVEIVDAGGLIVGRATTAVDGSYRIADQIPGMTLHVRFRDPGSNVVWGYPVNGEAGPGSSGASCNTAQAMASGTTSSCAGSGADPTLSVVLAAGQNLPQQSLPVDPAVVYDSGSRQPVAGSVVTLAPVGSCTGWSPASGIVAAALGGYTLNGNSIAMTVGTSGFYQFLFAPTAPATCTFDLTVTPPTGFHFASTLIPPNAGAFTAPSTPGSSAAVQPQGSAPSGPVGVATTYYLSISAGSATANVIHNHLPLDPDTPTGLSLAKTGDRSVAEIGDSVRYTITVQRSSGPVPHQVTVVDRLPAGFTFIAGTTVVNGVSVADPAGKPGPNLAFNLGTMPASGQLVLQYRVRIGVGSQQGNGINRAIGYGCGATQGCVTADGTSPVAGAGATNEGRFQVRVTGGVFTTDACFAGKIFVDCNENHVQDAEEIGIPGVRLVLSDGTTLISDSEGKYSYCGLAPRSHTLRVDETTLPRGSHLTTSSNRNLGDAGSLWLDLKNGELHRADFIEGSCSPAVIEQVKARRAQGEVRSVETEKKSLPMLKFDSRSKGPRPRTDAPAADSTGSTK